MSLPDYFTDEELACKHCLALGRSIAESLHFDSNFRWQINRIRHECGFPFIVRSGYRCHNHPIERVKPRPGAHCTGCAIDIAANSEQAHKIVSIAMAYGVRRIGVNQTGSMRFIHLDAAQGFPAPRLWSY